MMISRVFFGSGCWRRPIFLPFLLLFLLPMQGCTWWEKNVSKPVKKSVVDPVFGIRDRRITITSDPPGANVYVDEVFQGKTPLTLNYKLDLRDLMKGFVVVVQKEGYLPVRREVSYETESVTFRLIRNRRR